MHKKPGESNSILFENGTTLRPRKRALDFKGVFLENPIDNQKSMT
jgi:hypothetical protein